MKDIYLKVDKNQNTYLTLQFSYKGVTIPKDYNPDGNSIPRILNFLIERWEYPQVYSEHDYIYETGILPRIEADRRYRDNLVTCGYSRFKAYLLYFGLRIFGSKYYSNIN